MSESIESRIAEAEGPAALPRRNGELVFDAPWESRAFAIAVGLSGEVYEWEDFRTELINRIGEWEADPARTAEEWSYYDRWLLSLESMLFDRGAISKSQLEARITEVAQAQAHEHDHSH